MALTTMYEGMNNSPQTDITAAITASDTVIPVSSVSVFPVAPNLATLGSDENAEVIRYNGIDGSTLTGCERGFGGTTASPWVAGTVISRQITKYDLDTLVRNIIDLNNRKLETMDTEPTAGSTKPVQSDGIAAAISQVTTIANGKVSKSGDTMTGNLVIEDGNNTFGLELNRSGDSARGGVFRFMKGELTERIYLYHFKNNNTNYDMFKFPATTHSETSNGIYELLSTKNVVTTEQGGTGGTDSGWLSLPANSTVYTGTIRYRRIGKWVEVNLYQIKLVSDLTSTAGITLNTLPSGYRPDRTVSLGAGNATTGIGLLWIGSNGNLQFYKPAGVSSYPNTQNIYGTAMFFV